MIVVIGGICLIVGMIIGAFFKEPADDCPRRVLGYNCMGDWCDHRKSVLYTNMASMARNDEEREKDPNFWKGDSNENL